jgi:hypothetical protein
MRIRNTIRSTKLQSARRQFFFVILILSPLLYFIIRIPVHSTYGTLTNKANIFHLQQVTKRGGGGRWKCLNGKCKRCWGEENKIITQARLFSVAVASDLDTH